MLGRLTELLNPANHARAPTTDQVAGHAIGSCAGGVVNTGHALVNIGQLDRDAGGVGDGAGRICWGCHACLQKIACGCVAFSSDSCG